MKINPSIITQLDTRDNRFELAKALDTSEGTIRRYLKDNDEDGELTKKTALLKIEEITGITEAEILIDEPSKTTA